MAFEWKEWKKGRIYYENRMKAVLKILFTSFSFFFTFFPFLSLLWYFRFCCSSFIIIIYYSMVFREAYSVPRWQKLNKLNADVHIDKLKWIHCWIFHLEYWSIRISGWMKENNSNNKKFTFIRYLILNIQWTHRIEY